MMNFVATPFGKMDTDSAIRVANYFANAPLGATATAADLGVSGAFMTSLVNRGYAMVVGKKEGIFIEVDDGLYRKVDVNIYALCVAPSVLWSEYVKSAEMICNSNIKNAIATIETAQSLLEKTKAKLDTLDRIKF